MLLRFNCFNIVTKDNMMPKTVIELFKNWSQSLGSTLNLPHQTFADCYFSTYEYILVKHFWKLTQKKVLASAT